MTKSRLTKTRVSAARKVAVQVLGDVRRREARARDVLRNSQRMDALDPQSRAQAMRLVMGVIGSSGMLDEVIDSHAKARSGVEPQVRDALRVSSYELLFLSTPASVAVSQGVELVRGVRARAAGMANAILRRIADEDVPRRNEALERVESGQADDGDLVLTSGYPKWLLDRVTKDRGYEAARAFALAALEPAPVYVAPNLARTRSDGDIDSVSPDRAAFELLKNAGLSPRMLVDDEAIVLDAPAGLARSGLVQSVEVVPADLSAQRIAARVVPREGGRLLEIGQGRGTKSLLMQNAARRYGCELAVMGVDIEPFKTKVARDRMARAGLSDHVTCVTFDACELNVASAAQALGTEELDAASAANTLGTHEPFDVVFVDAPCSGSGTLRRHPEIAWSLKPEDVASLSALQLNMLRAAASWVRPGGLLCYATCSVFKSEDEDVVEAFLSEASGQGFEQEDRTFFSLPRRGEPDGHFCAFLRRNANEG
jgi:16S rRNA (cytosine967-C5)-methyltransferase